jgi:hypothetical protein
MVNLENLSLDENGFLTHKTKLTSHEWDILVSYLFIEWKDLKSKHQEKKQIEFPLKVRNIKSNRVHVVSKYIISGDGELNVYCHDWYGRHAIGYDCEFI